MKNIVIIASLEKNFATSGVGKYILWYKEVFEKKHTVSYLFQPASHGKIQWFLWRIFVLPQILKKKYSHHIKIFYDENFLSSRRKRMNPTSIFVVHHYPCLIKSKSLLERLMQPIHYLSFRYILPRLRYIVPVSQFTQATLIKYNLAKTQQLYCIENCIDESVYIPINDKDILSKKAYLSQKYCLPTWHMLLNVAVAEYRKNIPTLIRLLHLLPEKYFLVRIWKHLPWRETLRIDTLVKQYNLQHRYIHLSSIKEADLVAFYQTAKLFLFPSLFEWFGRPPLEAQACWCPVITTNKWALREVIGESGYIVLDEIDEDQWCTTVDILQNTPIKEAYIKKWLENAKKYSKNILYKKRENLLQQINTP